MLPRRAAVIHAHEGSMLNRILIYGNDPTLLMTRRLIFEKAGFQVLAANDFGTAIKISMTQTLEVLILCQSLSIAECMGILTTVREIAPSLRIIILDNSREVPELKAHEKTVEVLASPEVLISVVNQMVTRE
jgi:DNA-binding response OmpR family regulator